MSEQITIRGDQAELVDDMAGFYSIPVEKMSEGIADSTVQGMTREPVPDNVKWHIRAGRLSIFIVQLTPEVRYIKWLADDSPAPFGPEATYVHRCLATPYVVLKVPFLGQRIIPRIEVFYRNRPIKNLDRTRLYWPNLYNVSVNAYECTAWYCSQHLHELRRPLKYQTGLEAISHHLFGGGFNASSEHHEGLSTFGLYAQGKADPRITDVKRWEEASRENPRFVLSVKWQSAGLTVKELLDRELAFHNTPTTPRSAAELGNIILRKAKPK